MSKKHLEKKYKVHQPMVSRLILNKKSIHQKIENLNSEGGNIKMKRLMSILDSQFERALLLWFSQARSLGQPVTGPI